MQAAPLSPLAQLLWYKLIQIENRERWPEYVTVPNQDLTTLINVSQRNTAAKARTELVDTGYLIYTPGRKGAPGRYTLRLLNSRYRFTDKSYNDLDEYFGMTPEVKEQIIRLTGELFAENLPDHIPTGNDLKNVYEAICNQNQDDEGNWSIEIDGRKKSDLLYAFQCAANANAVNWNYIFGVLKNINLGGETIEHP